MVVYGYTLSHSQLTVKPCH